MSGRYIVIPPSPGRAVIVLSAAEVLALHILVEAALSDPSGARQLVSGASKYSSGQQRLDAGRRAAEMLADVHLALDKYATPEGEQTPAGPDHDAP
jgi:X-X-X-Leu-X-X-Gly heptad repeat protein